MRHVLLIREPREQRDARSELEGRALDAEMVAFGENLGDRLVARDALRANRHAVRVQMQQGRRVLHDGPFTVSKEMLGGFFLLECADMDEALASACGWCRDRWGLSWQITPRVLMRAIADPDPATAQRAFAAMMTMGKIDIAAIEATRRG